MKAKSGDKVAVHYVGTFPSGEVFDSSVARNEPIEFELGSGQMIPGFDKAVMGMEVAEKKKINLGPDEAYGPVDKDRFYTFPKENLPEGMEPKAGDQLMLSDNAGNQVPVTVSEVAVESVTVDANHPMAGKELVFDIELVSIN